MPHIKPLKPHMNTSYRHIIALSLPVLLANIAMPLQSVIDTAIVGHFDDAYHLAGMGLAVQFIAVFLISFNFLQYATSGLSAQAKGKLDTQGSNLHPSPLLFILQRALVLAIVIGLVITALQSWLIPLGLKLLSAPSDSYASAVAYLQIRLWGVIPELMNYAFIGWFAGQGKTKLMLYQQSFIACVNVLLTLCLVYVFDIGIQGVALGTTLAYWLSFIMAIVLVSQTLNQSLLQSFSFRSHEFTLSKFSELFKLNTDIFIRTLLLTLSFAWITRLSAQSGDLILATNAILLQILSLSAYALDGLAVAAETLSGQSAGRQDWQKFRVAVKRTGIASFALASLLSVFWWLGFEVYLQLMTDIYQVSQLAYEHRWLAIALPVVGVGAYWLDGVFFGLIDGKVIRNTAILVAVLFFPISWQLYQYSVSINQPMIGIWLSVWIFLLLRFLVLGWFFYQKTRSSF